MGCSQEDATRGLNFSDDMRGSRGRQDPILSIDQFGDLFSTTCRLGMYAVGSSHLCDDLHDFFVIVATVSSDDKRRTLHARRRNSLKDSLNINSIPSIEADLNKVLGVVLLHEHLNSFPQSYSQPIPAYELIPLVPGFWPSKGVVLCTTLSFIVTA